MVARDSKDGGGLRHRCGAGAGPSGFPHMAVVVKNRCPKWVALVNGNMEKNQRFSGGFVFDPYPYGCDCQNRFGIPIWGFR